MIGVGVFRPCPVHLGGHATGLACTCAEGEGHPDGHTYASTSGSWLEPAS